LEKIFEIDHEIPLTRIFLKLTVKIWNFLPNDPPLQKRHPSANPGYAYGSHPDTQAIFTSVASFNALTKSDTIQRVSRPFPSKSRFPPIPRAHNCHGAVLLSV
jgi:hypothetical protein